ncbi:SAM-dependent methyltransferase [Hahella chejuensis KCTC 2396]|uniref:Malonyl-[acyl-carrier protein] O-methyltransferase n=1 Tax=Hahella chejuensis (strain KCTC 2396) TaxID=349521 RepID=BIOC_HAHCH|nr:malonyl-ACP O-methyltransferase BioC [Hahella chejuensis]Q2SBD7.1 RecName: Full=Malonyl-[acyl-carrier protein] O-methyltransferase; Short=Malonyl-ACP O-methyltransferase; AltName: Full=Biotin synthesis protein BioC [Hahella chejuensis KCTC 2396]ABC32037.1 SAM-dependent methyltransferase [Hahella chejuensis KCTC 2396]
MNHAVTIKSFVSTSPLSDLERGAVDKSKVAESFSAAAATYDLLAGMQKEVGESLVSLSREGCPQDIIDVGCGTGWLTHRLKNSFPEARLCAYDLSPGMIEYALAHHDNVAEIWAVADMESLPVANASQDLVFSNMAMQWLDDPRAWFAEASRVLRPGGRLICSTLLTQTLFELEQAWHGVDGGRHVNRFLSAEQVAEAAVSCGLRGECRESLYVRFHDSALDVMKELKGIGAHNIQSERPQGLTGKRRLRRVIENYEKCRQEQGVPATYHVGVCVYSRI